MTRAAGIVLSALVLAWVTPARAAEAPPPAGTWKVVLPLAREIGGRPLWLVKLENKDGKWAGRVLAHDKEISTATLEGLTVSDGRLRFTLLLPEALRFDFRLPGEKSARLFGTFTRGGSSNAAELEATTLSSLDPFDVNKEIVATSSGGAQVVRAALSLLTVAAEKKARPEEVRAWAARAVKAAEPYGPRWQREVVLAAAAVLAEQKGFETIALTYARQAERQLDDKDRPTFKRQVLEVLAAALEKAGKADEAKEVKARLDKIDYTVKPERFPGAAGKGDRTVLVELFTGAQHPGCVAADMAFDALGKTFKPAEVVRLQYHLSIPGPDPLANPDGEARAEFYRRSLRSLPAVFFDGKAVALDNGGTSEGWDVYDQFRDLAASLLEKPAGARLTARATRKGPKVTIDVTAGGVQAEGDKVRLRVALVEEQVKYAGSNKVPSYQHVVRAFAGGAEGEKVARGKDVSKTFTVDLDQVRKGLREYLEKADKANPFPNKERPLALEKLRVVAFVQNDATREVLQAVQADVPAE